MAATGAAFAHHSFSMYDRTTTIDLNGTVARFRWINPHTILSVAVDGDGAAEPVVWNVELSSPGNLTRTGWNRRWLAANDRVRVTINPLRSGEPGGACVRVTKVDTGDSLECGAGEAIRAGERPNLP